ncbi:Uncharacterised protein [Plesiomonas shigelloides]|uniref:hypothetical protein n=1 Tax=Plesiomonas shigelloides TaxID=703 RepID=UPI000DF902FF|nr:hypothetical protein [Plesiomonas shigelloides]SUB63972.1 Uncharacterised protein [Plesiomonas shigelloides]
MKICITLTQINWELTKDVFAIISSIATIFAAIATCIAASIALKGINTWKKSIKLQKKYDYIQCLNEALDTMKNEMFQFKRLTQSNNFHIEDVKFLEAKSDFKRYTSLLKEELTSQ